MSYTALQLAEAFITTGELDDALVAINEHLAESPEDDPARRMRIGVLLRLDDEAHWQAALKDIMRLGVLTSDDFVAWMRVLDALSNDGVLDVARRMHRAYPDDERSAEIFVERLVAASEYTEAEAVLSTMPEGWRWLQWRGDLAAMQSQHEAAAAYYTRALVLLQTAFKHTSIGFAANFKASLLIKRGHAHRCLDQLDEAESDYVAAEKLIPGDVMIAFNRGLLAALRDELPLAVELCRDAISRANETLRLLMHEELSTNEQFVELQGQLTDE